MTDSFIFYRSFYDSIKELPEENKGQILDAICLYALEKITPNFSGINKAIFTLIKPQIDANIKRRENGENGGKYGYLGGRPKNKNPKETPRKPQRNPKGVKSETPNDNVNVNVNANENDVLISKPKKGSWGDWDDIEDLKHNPENPRAFCGNVIKLRQKDFDKMVLAAGLVPVIDEDYFFKQLSSRDDWMSDQEPHVKKNWYMSTMKWAESFKGYA